MNQLVRFLGAIALAMGGHVATAVDLHVSPEGNDNWTGTLEKPNDARTDVPLASIVGARDAIRRLNASGPLQQPVCVHIQAGEHATREPIEFESQDSGEQRGGGNKGGHSAFPWAFG